MVNSGVLVEHTQVQLEDAPGRKMRWPIFRLDPRTTILMVLAINLVAFTTTSVELVLACVAVTAVFVYAVAKPKHCLWWTLALVVFLFCWLAVPKLAPARWSFLLSYGAYWFVRFALVAGWGIFAVSSLRVPDVAAVLTRLHAPQWIHVPALVMLRFFPVAIAELRAISEAMVLRGLKPGAGGLALHPLRTGELMMIPFLASSARIADELSAAALLKGVGIEKNRTSIVNLKFRIGDAIALGCLFAMLVWKVVELL